jgi:hypothetical protein
MTKINDPVLVPDVSSWCDHINAKEFEDGGCQSVVVGLYPITQNGKQVLNPVCRAQCVEVATHSKMVLQGYVWDDIINDPIKQADWFADMLASEGLPISWVWADQEQWWTNWFLWNQYRRGIIPASLVPRAPAANISGHNQAFNKQFHTRFPNHGVYTNKNFVVSYAYQMDFWLPQYDSWVAHYKYQPQVATKMTWAEFQLLWMPNYDVILSAGQPAARFMGHQFTGDRCILPGSYTKYNQMQALDVSVFSKAFIEKLRGGVYIPPVPPPTPTDYIEYIVTEALINVRATGISTGTWVRYAAKGEVLKMKKPLVRSAAGYLQMTDGNWVFADYVKPKV